MATYVVRMWLPDRPGALGQVASRIGALRGDVIGIEILERGAGRAIDELVVSLPEPGVLELLISEISEVDGVDVEDVREVVGEPLDQQVAALAIAGRMADAPDIDGVLAVLCAGLADVLDCDWVAVLTLEPPLMSCSTGQAPSAAWLAAFLSGVSHLESSEDEGNAPPDLIWAALRRSGLELVAGRRSRAFHTRERRHATALAGIGDSLVASPSRAVWRE